MRVSALLIVALAAAAGSSAAAQNSGGVDWSLLKPPPDYVGGAMNSYEQCRRIALEREEERQRQEQLEALQTRRWQQQNVAALVSQGKCDDAVRAALAFGGLGMAQQAKELCAAPKPAQQNDSGRKLN